MDQNAAYPKADSVVICDKDGRGKCDYQREKYCHNIPMEFGGYCAYEKKFINDRYNDLVKLFGKFKACLAEIGVNGFALNHSTLFSVCFKYANNLKVIRRFHDISGGCDKSRRAAYLSLLISDAKPVHIAEMAIPNNAGLQNSTIYIINEMFAINAMLYFINMEKTMIYETEGFDRIIKNLKFIFGKSDPLEESLVCIARLLEKTDAMNQKNISLSKECEHAKNLNTELMNRILALPDEGEYIKLKQFVAEKMDSERPMEDAHTPLATTP